MEKNQFQQQRPASHLFVLCLQLLPCSSSSGVFMLSIALVREHLPSATTMGAASIALALLGRSLFFLLCICICPERRRSGPQLQNQIAAWSKTGHFFPRKTTSGGETPGWEGKAHKRNWGIHTWVPMQL